ncbi:MAG TPA: UDP-N-acetylmuramate--L-alanine ligase [Candidatus Dormibacteraeota bacterium]|nr:UDP-N-acetylmuramate--L-alanine ligase [Candidatus Dormibacteraeota bacterium]
MTGHVHFLGICGYAVSGAALVAREQGWRVSGSDDEAYPPTTDILTAAGVDWVDGSDPANLERWGVPDLVVVGNQTRMTNPEWLAARDRGLPTLSEIEFYLRLTAERRRIAVCGTHGKTTTAALLAHMLARCGLDPGFRLGSTSLDLGGSARLGTGPFVFEGDEYTTAPWDARPKFLHIRPAAACVTRLELDHPDIYPTLDAYRAPFAELARSMPRHGLLVLCADDPECAALATQAASRVLTYGCAEGADWRVRLGQDDGMRQTFELARGGEVTEVTLTFPGRHSALNATAALALAEDAGAPLQRCIEACADFRGPARRFEVVGEVAGITVVDDYAHHPTEVEVTIAAARQRYPGRRLVAIHTPHTYSRTRTLLDDYAHSFSGADVVVLGPIEMARERGMAATVSSHDVAARVGDAVPVHVVGSSAEAIELLADIARPGDVLLVLSLGGFDKIALRLPAALEAAGVR